MNPNIKRDLFRLPLDIQRAIECDIALEVRWPVKHDLQDHHVFEPLDAMRRAAIAQIERQIADDLRLP